MTSSRRIGSDSIARAFASPFEWLLLASFVGLLAMLLASCGGGGGGGGASQESFSVTNGFGDPLLPHRIHVPDALGNPTSSVVEIRSLKTLVDNKPSDSNPVMNVATWPTTAVLPNQAPGNHFVLISFGGDFVPDASSILDPSSPTGLTGALTVNAVDPVSGTQTPVPGRMFVNGRTAANGAIETWVVKGPKTNAQIPEPLHSQIEAGFPGIASPFTGADKMVGPRSVVFVADQDDDLSTLETFPIGKNIKISVGVGVRSTSGKAWPSEAVAVSTVGPDHLSPEVSIAAGTALPIVDPQSNASMVPVDKHVTIAFTEPVQPHRVGPLPSALPPSAAGNVQLRFTVGASTSLVPFTVLPESPLNFTRMVLTPAFPFPGSYFKNGPAVPDSSDVVFTMTIDATTIGQIADLVYDATTHTPVNTNTIPRSSQFTTAPGAGVVNAPVAPEAVYVGFGSGTPGIGVLDLDGFGQGTGTPQLDNPATLAIEPGSTNFPHNPDLLAGLTPPLVIEHTPLAGGSLGPLTLTRDTSATNFVLAQPPLVNGVRDMAIGMPLDIVFNNGTCSAGGGNFCAKDSFHFTSGNSITAAPAPNPPKLTTTPLCLSPFIGAQEPISVDNATLSAFSKSLCTPGNFIGNPSVGIPPQGLFTDNPTPYGPVWPGPSLPPTGTTPACSTFVVRQQIGHFLYVIDPVLRRVVVLNSNRMTVITTIPQPDPVNLAMSPDCKIIGVSNFSTNQVQFIDTNPLSTTFHKVIQTTSVGLGPMGIAWQPDGEDVFVANSLSNTVSILNGQSRVVRKTIANQLSQPFEVALTSRQTHFGFTTGVYFGYILNKNGTVAIYESGPGGIQGIGFDDTVGVVNATFPTPTAMQADVTNFNSGVWILHKNSVGQPTASNLSLTSSPVGPQPFSQFLTFPVPSFRSREWTVVQTIAPSSISGGAPQDLAFDDSNNIAVSAANLHASGGSVGALVPHSAKTHYRGNAPVIPLAASHPKAMFLSNFDTGKIDVISLATSLPIVAPRSAPGAQVLCSYWRQ